MHILNIHTLHCYRWVATCSSVTVSLTAILIWWSIITDNRMSNATPISTSPTWDKFISGYIYKLFYVHIQYRSFCKKWFYI